MGRDTCAAIASFFMSKNNPESRSLVHHATFARSGWSRTRLAEHPVRTERLVIRPLDISDAEDVWRYQQDSEILRYIPWPERTRDEARAHTERRALAGESLSSNGDHVFLAVELSAGPERGRVIGDLMLRIANTARNEVEIGFVFARDHQGEGYASEATSALLRFAFETLAVRRVVAVLDERNRASAALCSRLGMRHEGTDFEAEYEADGWVHLEFHAVDRYEWAAQMAGSPAPRRPSPKPVAPIVVSESQPSLSVLPSALPSVLPCDLAEKSLLPVHTERLVIRQYRETDGTALSPLLSDPEITRYLPAGPAGLDVAIATAQKNASETVLSADGDAVKLAIEWQGTFVGQVKLQLTSLEHHVFELGWTLAPSAQGRGLATEAVTAMLDLAVDSLGAHRVTAQIVPANLPSVALAERLGMRLERLSRLDQQDRNGEWTDIAVYAITAAEWRARSLPE